MILHILELEDFKKKQKSKNLENDTLFYFQTKK